MKLVTFNCNFNKGGIGMVQDLLEGDSDIICLQRFDAADLPKLRLHGREHHFFSSFPGEPELSSYGLLTVWDGWMKGTARGISLDDHVTWKDRYQGNSMVRLDTETHSVINSLVGYPQDGTAAEIDTWRKQVNQCIGESRDGRSILVGDFHHTDDDPIWQGIELGTMVNVAGLINSFRTPRSELISLTKIFVGSRIMVHDVEPAINPFKHPSWQLKGMHWPVAMEYLP